MWWRKKEPSVRGSIDKLSKRQDDIERRVRRLEKERQVRVSGAQQS